MYRRTGSHGLLLTSVRVAQLPSCCADFKVDMQLSVAILTLNNSFEGKRGGDQVDFVTTSTEKL